MNDNILKLGLPKGSLEESTIELFKKAGWTIRKNYRNYFPEINDKDISAKLCKAQEIPKYVEDGILDLALTGYDWLLETKADAEIISHLIYSKSSNTAARWVLAVASDSPYTCAQDLKNKRIATELHGLTEKYFAEKNIPVQIVHSYGATEAKIVEGLADAIVEITETETTIKAHNLKVIDELLITNTVLIANKDALKNPIKKAKIEQIDLLLHGALKADSMVCLKMNAPENKLKDIMNLLPALNSPTISSLNDNKWLSLETVVSKDIVRDLIPNLRNAGAEGIIEYSLNKVI